VIIIKVLIELEISGDFEEGLSEEEIEKFLDTIIENGARSNHCDGRYIIEN
jgi:hypothetical protein